MCCAFDGWGNVVITAVVVHADGLFAAGDKDRCDRLGRDLEEMVPVKNLGELRLYPVCAYERGKEAGSPTISQQTYVETFSQSMA